MTEIGRHLWMSSFLLLKEESPKSAYLGLCPDGFWNPPRMETPQLLWITCVSTQVPSQGKHGCWCSNGTSCVSVCPLSLVLSLGTTEKSLCLSSLHLPLSYLYALRKYPRVFPSSWANQSQLSQPSLIWWMLQSLNHFCCTLLDPLQEFHVSWVLERPTLDKALRMWPQWGWVETEDQLLWPAGNIVALLCPQGVFLAWSI